MSPDLEWKVLYVGSARDSHKDQILDEILVGPVPVGINKFVLQADAPDYTQLPPEDVLGVTVVLVTCSYREKEFVRIGYYVNNEYTGVFDPEIGPPTTISGPNFDMTLVQRQILADKPRVTKFPISWNTTTTAVASTTTTNDDATTTTQQQQVSDWLLNAVDPREIELEVIAKGYNNPDAVEGYYNEDDDDIDDDDDNNNFNNNNTSSKSMDGFGTPSTTGTDMEVEE